MNRGFATAAAMVAALAAAVMTAPGRAQQPACLHGADESAAEAARRQAAVGFVRVVNTAQARTQRSGSGYAATLAALQAPAAPAGFRVQMTSNADGYAVAVKDAQDPCGYALFTDQQGVIYTASPLQ